MRASIYAGVGRQSFSVTADVTLGTTSEMGPNPDSIDDIGVEDANGKEVDYLRWLMDLAGARGTTISEAEEEITRKLFEAAR